jgi:hypothetical protein
MVAYLVGEAGIRPDSKTRPEVAGFLVSTLSDTSALATVASLKSDTVPIAAFATRFADATAALAALAGLGFPNTLSF